MVLQIGVICIRTHEMPRVQIVIPKRHVRPGFTQRSIAQVFWRHDRRCRIGLGMIDANPVKIAGHIAGHMTRVMRSWSVERHSVKVVLHHPVRPARRCIRGQVWVGRVVWRAMRLIYGLVGSGIVTNSVLAIVLV